MFSVFIQPVFLFLNSRRAIILDQKPTAQGVGQVELDSWAEAWSCQALGDPGLPASSCAMLAWPHPICWHHYLVLGQQDRVLQVVFYPNDQKTNSETPRCQAYKNLCYHVDLIQDFSTYPNFGTNFC